MLNNSLNICDLMSERTIGRITPLPTLNNNLNSRDRLDDWLKRRQQKQETTRLLSSLNSRNNWNSRTSNLYHLNSYPETTHLASLGTPKRVIIRETYHMKDSFGFNVSPKNWSIGFGWSRERTVTREIIYEY